MYAATEEIIETIREQFQLHDFYLEKYDFLQQEKNQLDMQMTWLPNKGVKENDIQPAGTVEIDVDINTKKIKQLFFVDETNMLPADIFPHVDNMEAIMEWVEDQTQLEYGRQFKLVTETKERIIFHAAVDNIRLFPGGTIDISFNEDGLLTSFSIDGTFADESQIAWEPFNLVDEVIQPLAKQHCKLIEVPDEPTAAWKPLYVISSFLVSNQNPDSVMYFDEAENNFSYKPLDIPLSWQTNAAAYFEKKDIHFHSILTEEEAFQESTMPDNNLPIPEDTVEQAVTAITQMLQKEFPNDSGLWRLTSVKRERGYLLARLDPAKATPKVIYPSLMVWVNPETLEADNYMDATPLLEAFDIFEEAETVKVSADTAAGLLYDYMDVEPVYVFNPQTKMYQLYGKVTNGDYAVHAVTGELCTAGE